jgi:tetratricopeptide (TPR) repeat protein
MACFPHRRFDAYQLLADLVESRAVREISPPELAKVAEELARHNRERALVLLERGLVAQPRNHELLVVKATLSETVGELEDASEALKMLVHLHLEAGERDEARARLDQLKELSPSDPAVWQRSFSLALVEERHADAQREGRRLAELYREPGLFKKAGGVLERLVELDGSSWELARELARTRADAGEAEAAVRGLERFGEERLTNGEYPLALHVYEEILSIDPKNARAKDTIELIQSGELERRRARRRRVIRRLSLAACAVALVGWLAYEGRARAAYLETTRAIGRERLIEATRYEEAIRRFEAVRADYPLATSAWIDARLVIADLRARQRED